MSEMTICIVGGGAAGIFAGITAAECDRRLRVCVLEKSGEFLSKVRISGGGRCNVTHACFDAREFASRFPRGQRELIGPFQRFGAADTMQWFESRGVKLKTEPDGRVFPASDSSGTIVDCLLQSAKQGGVMLMSRQDVKRIERGAAGGFELVMADGGRRGCDVVMLAMGGCRTMETGRLAEELGHQIEPPVPSLFTFEAQADWVRRLAGISVDPVEVEVAGTNLREHGALLMTHTGLSGPVILRLSAWGARVLHGMQYRFDARINWLPGLDMTALKVAIETHRAGHGAKLVSSTPVGGLPTRLWEQLVWLAGVGRNVRWSGLTKMLHQALVRQLGRTELLVSGKALNKEEFVTCGGVRLSEVNFKTMESRLCWRLFFGGELLDVDGITGGFNFQTAWTTGWLAGKAMGRLLATKLHDDHPHR